MFRNKDLFLEKGNINSDINKVQQTVYRLYNMIKISLDKKDFPAIFANA